MKILLVEDEAILSGAIEKFLCSEGFVCETAADFDHAFEKVTLYKYDCILLDITLPGGSGFQVLEQLKTSHPDAGVIIISAKNSLEDKLSGLDSGADDYLTKPFHLSELNSRIKSVLRRRKFEGKSEIEYGAVRIIPDQQLVFANGQELKLTRKEFELLLFFAMNRNRVLSRESIAEHLWGDEADQADSFDFLYSHIKNLRKKIEENGCQSYIQTVYGIGYKFSEA